MSKQLDDRVLQIIEDATICKETFSIKLNSGQIDKETYKLVDEVFKRLRGKWKGGKTQAHLFPYDPTPYIEALLVTKEMPDKNPTAFFPTPRVLVEEILDAINFVDLSDLDYLDEDNRFRILEPSGGTGGIADVIKQRAPNAQMDIVEFLPLNQSLLKKKGYAPICGDFMEFNTDYTIKYDYIIMNPPFSLEGDKIAYITHIEHAIKMLKPTCTLVAIAPKGFLNNSSKKEKSFKEYAMIHGEISDNEKEAFKESGTLVDTVTIILENKDWKYKPFQGYSSHFVWEFGLYLENESELVNKAYSLYTAKEFDEEKAIKLAYDLLDILAKRYVGLDSSLMDDYIAYMKKQWEYEHEDEIEDSTHEDTVNTKEVIGTSPINNTNNEQKELEQRQIEAAKKGGNLLDLMSA